MNAFWTTPMCVCVSAACEIYGWIYFVANDRRENVHWSIIKMWNKKNLVEPYSILDIKIWF